MLIARSHGPDRYPGRLADTLIRKRSVVQVQTCISGGLHVSPVSMFTFGTDMFVCWRTGLNDLVRGAAGVLGGFSGLDQGVRARLRWCGARCGLPLAGGGCGC